MKIPDLMKDLLLMEFTRVETHPTICDPNNVIHTMQILNELIDELRYKFEDEDPNSIEMSPVEWADIIENVSQGENPTIDILVDYLREKNEIHYPKE